MSDSERSSREEEDNETMRIFLRLRPFNKLETSRRSKNCVELDEDPRYITVDSPLEGEYDFSFDHVFEEYASQEEVFDEAVAPVPSKLLEGYNCTVIAYGQTGTGKTHTMMGVNGGADGLLALSKRAGKADDSSPREEFPEAEGMILKTAHSIFQKIQQAPSSVEFTIRCSYVEIYLEKILDLLNPSGGETLSVVDDLPADEAAGVGDENPLAGVRIDGAAELYCFDEADVYGLLARGNACRTMSSTEMNTDSSRSHAIFIMKIEQSDKATGRMTKSVLHMVDLAGSELAASQSSASQRGAPGGASPVQLEATMINKSLNALNNVIRAQLDKERGGKHSVAAISRQSKLTKLLRPCFGGNCLTTLVLTASPSSYNIGETMSTIRFGQRVRRIHNPVVINSDFTHEEYRRRLKESEKTRTDQFNLLRALAFECTELKEKAHNGTFDGEKHSGPVWDSIRELLECGTEDEVGFKSLVRRRSTDGLEDDSVESGSAIEDNLEKAQREVRSLREQLEAVSKARYDVENQLSELESEVAVLRSQNEHLIENKTKDMQELIDAKNELQIISQRKIELEHNFRTSQFRENEAIVFLRQIRRFYRNVLRDKAAQGSGSINAIAKEVKDLVPNAPDLEELVDIDALLVEAGVIEEHEIYDDKAAAVYIPSKAALIRSAAEAKKAAQGTDAMEKELAREAAETAPLTKKEEAEAEEGTGSRRTSLVRRGSAIRRSSFAARDGTKETIEDAALDGADAGAGSSTSQSLDPAETDGSESNIEWDQSGLTITRRQQLLGTPSGRLSLMREKIMDKENLEMTDRCLELEQALKEERATIDLLSGRAGGLNKKKLAQEAIQLRQQVEKKTQNLMAIAWKMNELNLINKSYNEKMVNREQHVIYLEENYLELQNRNRQIIEERQEAERKLRDELDSLQKVLDGMSVSLWQLKENKTDADRTFAGRIVIPVQGGPRPSVVDTRQRRLSDAEEEPSLGPLEDSGIEKTDATTQTEEVCTVDTEVQTDEVPEVVREDAGVQTEEEESVEKAEVATQTDEVFGQAISSDVDHISQSARAVQLGEPDENDEPISAGTIAAVGAIGAAAGAATAGAVSLEATDDTTKDASAVSEATSAAISQASVDAAERDLNVISEETPDEVDRELDVVSEASPDAVSIPSVEDTDKELRAVGGSAAATTFLAADEHRDVADGASTEDVSVTHGEEESHGSLFDSGPEEDRMSSVELDETSNSAVSPEPADEGMSTTPKNFLSALTTSAVTRAAADEKKSSEDEKDALSAAKNVFASTVLSVLNRGGNGAKTPPDGSESKDDEEEMELYEGDGHSPRRMRRLTKDIGSEPSLQKIDLTESARDEWAAARDDFESIVEETAKSVSSSATKRRALQQEQQHGPVEPVDPNNSLSEFLDRAKAIGHKREDAIVTMGSKRQLVGDLDTIEEKQYPSEKETPSSPRPWQRDSPTTRKPWTDDEKKRQTYKREASSSSFDVNADWLDDDISYDSVKADKPVRPLLDDKKIPETTSEDEFDQMMNATQAALVAAQEIDQESVYSDPFRIDRRGAPAVLQHVVEDEADSAAGLDEMFVGGRTKDYAPRRTVEARKIRAGVMKEKTKPSRSERGKSSRDLLRKRTESRRGKMGEERKKKKKKKSTESKRSGRSSRDLRDRTKSERFPQKEPKKTRRLSG